ncbi:ParA family protein [Faecalimonas sp.]
MKKRMETIALLDIKGGVGKTTSAKEIAHMLATIYGKKVLEIDMDPQSNLSDQFNEFDFVTTFNAIRSGKRIAGEYSIEHLLMDNTLDIHKCIKSTGYDGVDIIPAFLTLSEVEELLKADIKTPQQFKLKSHLDTIAEEYDYCIIDCSPSISILNINALVAADKVYIPTRTDAGSCVGIAITMNLIDTVKTYNPRLVNEGCFFTQYDNTNIAKEVKGMLEELLPGQIIPITIPRNKYIAENSYMKMPLLIRDTKGNPGKITRAYMLLTAYIEAANKKVFLEKLESKGKDAIEEELIQKLKERGIY